MLFLRGLRMISLSFLLGSAGCDEEPVRQPSSSVTHPVVETEPPPAPPTEPEASIDPQLPSGPAVVTVTPEMHAASQESQAALRQGRRLSRAASHTEAIIAFERSIALHSTPVARCELGWAAYHAGDPERAFVALSSAVASFEGLAILSAKDRRTMAACLYNLGRVAEERNDPEGAIASYQRSLSLRPNEAVARHLTQLGGNAAAAICPPTPCFPMDPTEEALIARVHAEAHRLADVQSPGHTPRDSRRPGQVRVIHRSNDSTSDAISEVLTLVAESYETNAGTRSSYAFLGIRTSRGYQACATGGGSPGGWWLEVTAAPHNVRQVIAGGAPEVTVRVRSRECATFAGMEDCSADTMTHVCGLDPAGNAVCWGAMPVGRRSESDRENGREISVAELELSLQAPDRIVSRVGRHEGPAAWVNLRHFAGTFPVETLRCELNRRARENAR